MSPSVQYHCSCLSSNPTPPPASLASSSYSFHPLHTLYFCEECDAVRCNRCVSVEVSGYYCPNCLFEVPSASVRAEKNRCARNCFQCPQCRNTLAVVPSDPPIHGDIRSSVVPVGSIGEPPFFLYCNNCRWDSAEVGITFEKPTGLAVQLQKSEDSAPDSLEFERLKEHFEPVFRASVLAQAPSTVAHSHVNPLTAAANSALARDIPGVSKYNVMVLSRSGKDRTPNKDEMPVYKSRVEVGSINSLGPGGATDVEFMQHVESPVEIATLEQRWLGSWLNSTLARDLKPLRIPLHARLTKRCPACRHILIKPEQKAQSIRFKIKLVAANYLPAITVSLPHVQAQSQVAKRTSLKASTAEEEQAAAAATGLNAGKTYPFHLSLMNPLYDPVQVRLTSLRQLVKLPGTDENADKEKAPRAPFGVTLPTSAFAIGAFAEAWEYEDDEEMFGMEQDDMPADRAGASRTPKGKTKTVGVLERKANVTVVGGEVTIGKDAKGPVKFNMLVSFTYRSDDPTPSEPDEGDATVRPMASNPTNKAAPEMKTFSFYTVVDLGSIIPKEEPRIDPES